MRKVFKVDQFNIVLDRNKVFLSVPEVATDSPFSIGPSFIYPAINRHQWERGRVYLLPVPVLKEDLMMMMMMMISAILLYARLVMTSMMWMTLEMNGLTSMHHAPSFAALTSVVHLPTDVY